MPTKTRKLSKAAMEYMRIRETIYRTICDWMDGKIPPNGTGVGQLDQHQTALFDALLERLTKK